MDQWSGLIHADNHVPYHELTLAQDGLGMDYGVGVSHLNP